MAAVVVTVTNLVAGIIVATTVNGVNNAYAWSYSKSIKQTRVVVICANLDDKNKRTHIENVRCEINHDDIGGTVILPLRPDVIVNPLETTN